MKVVEVSTRELSILYNIDSKTADEIALKFNKDYGINCTGDEVEALLKEREIQKRNIRRSDVKVGKDYQFVLPDNGVKEVKSEVSKVQELVK